VSQATADDLTAYLDAGKHRITFVIGRRPAPKSDPLLAKPAESATHGHIVVGPGTIERASTSAIVLLGLSASRNACDTPRRGSSREPGWLMAFDDRIRNTRIDEHYRRGAINGSAMSEE